MELCWTFAGWEGHYPTLWRLGDDNDDEQDDGDDGGDDDDDLDDDNDDDLDRYVEHGAREGLYGVGCGEGWDCWRSPARGRTAQLSSR